MELKNYNRAIALMPIFTQDSRLLENLVNGYTEFPDKPYYDNNYFLMYQFDNPKQLMETEKYLEQNKYFSKTVDVQIDDIWYTIAIFTIPQEIKIEYDLVKQNCLDNITASYMKKFIRLFKSENIDLDKLITGGLICNNIPETQFEEIPIDMPNWYSEEGK